MFGLGGWLGSLVLIIIVIGVIVLIAWLVGRVAPATQPQAPTVQPAGQDAFELLRMRFARGEISEAEYRAAKQVLEEGR